MKIVNRKVQPLENEEKVKIGLAKAISERPEWKDMAVWVTDIKISSASAVKIAKGDRLTAKGTCVLNFRRHADGDILTPSNSDFTLVTTDAKNELGIPTVKVEKSDFSALPLK